MTNKTKLRIFVFSYLFIIIGIFSYKGIVYAIDYYKENNPHLFKREEFISSLNKQGITENIENNDYMGKNIYEETIYKDSDGYGYAYYHIKDEDTARSIYENKKEELKEICTDSHEIDFTRAEYFECTDDTDYSMYILYKDVILRGEGNISNKDIIKKNLIVFLYDATT